MTNVVLAGLRELVYPARCGLCGAAGPSPCLPCSSQFLHHDVGVQFFEDETLSFRACVYLYRGLCADAVQALKYERRTSLAGWMAAQLVEAVARFGLEYDFSVPVPIHWSRRAQRGFNQAELIAEPLQPRNDVLARVRRTRPQVGLSRDQRMTNLAGAFEASETVRGKRVLLIDDVFTSGGTARECSKALRSKGAKEVGILTLAGEPFLA